MQSCLRGNIKHPTIFFICSSFQCVVLRLNKTETPQCMICVNTIFKGFVLPKSNSFPFKKLCVYVCV